MCVCLSCLANIEPRLDVHSTVLICAGLAPRVSTPTSQTTAAGYGAKTWRHTPRAFHKVPLACLFIALYMPVDWGRPLLHSLATVRSRWHIIGVKTSPTVPGLD